MQSLAYGETGDRRLKRSSTYRFQIPRGLRLLLGGPSTVAHRRRRGSFFLESSRYQHHQVFLDVFGTKLVHQVLVLNSVKGTSDVENDDKGFQVGVQRFLPIPGEEQQKVLRGAIRSKPELLVRQEGVVPELAVDCLHHYSLEYFANSRYKGDRRVAHRVRY